MADAFEDSRSSKQRRKPSFGRREQEELGKINNVRTFLSKTNPSQASSVKIKSKQATPVHLKRSSVASSMQSNSTTTKQVVVKKKKAYTQLKKRQNVFSTPKRTRGTGETKKELIAKPTPGSRKKSSERLSIPNSGQKSRPKDKTTDEMMPSLGVSMNQAIDDKNLVGLQRAEQSVMTQKMHAFLRKNSNFEETKGFQRRPEEYQIEMKDETVCELEEPSEDFIKQQSFTIADDHSNPETLVTQIGIEETNIKTLGVSRTASKAHLAGSLTERQTHLLLLSSTNSNHNTQTQLETSIQAEGPTLAKKTFKRLGSATRQQPNMENKRILTGSRGGLTQALGSNRLSLGGHQTLDRSSSLQISGRTQVTPFLQRALINSDQGMTSKEFSEKLQKLKTLDKIDVSQNKITKIPYLYLLNHAQTLTYLCLDNNQIVDITEDTMRHLPNIATLKLRANKLNKLPDSLFSLTQLRILDVSSNKLTTISAKVSLLRQLQWLNISENRLEGLPNSIGYLDKLDSITSEFFVYLEDQGASSNLQIDSTGDPDLDWITQHHQRQTISKNAPDNRFIRLMEFMRLQIAVVSTFLELVHEFQHVEGVYYMIDSEPAMITDESEQLLQSVQSFNQMQSPSQMFDQPLLTEPSKDLTPSSLLTFGKYLPRCEYNELVTVFRTLSPNRANSNNTMLHLLVMHNHPHLLRQYIAGLQKIVANTNDTLQSSEVRSQFQTSYAQQNLLRNLQLHYNSKVRAAVNGINERGQTVLDIVLLGMQTEIADAFIALFGKYLEIDCQQEVPSTPRSEIRVIVPGNQQSNTAPQKPASAIKIHPIVTTLTSGRFHLTSKLVDIALDFHLKRRAHENVRKRYDSLLKEPTASQNSLVISSIVQNHAALQQTTKHLRNMANVPFNLNLADQETGMTYLHHLFANFDTNPEKAANLFRKLNSLHVRHASTTTGYLGVVRGVKSIIPRSPDNRTLALRGESTRQLTLGGSIDTRVSASQQRLFIGTKNPSIGQFTATGGPQNLAESDRGSPKFANQRDHEGVVGENASGPEIEPLELNPMTHYFETPFDFAVEHYQHSAVQFALNWNYNNLQSITHAKQNPKQQRSVSAKRSSTVGPLSSLEKQLSITRATAAQNEKAPRKFFDVMSQDNPRRLTPLHRVIINGNYNALKIILDSPLFYESYKFKKDCESELCEQTLIDLHTLDKLGRDPRDYAHKIVFMSKLLSQATCRKVWHQADLFSIKKQLAKQSQVDNEKQTKGGKLATYDKLISHTSMLARRSKHKQLNLSVQASHIIGGGLLSDMTVLKHTYINSHFMKTDEKAKNKKRKMYAGGHHHQHLRDQTRNSAVVDVISIRALQSSGLSHNDRRLVKSFASNNNTPNQKKNSTPQHGFTAATSIFATDLKQEKKQSPLKSNRSGGGDGVIYRQSLPATTAGFKKAKSMAFNTQIKSRVEQFEQHQRRFVENATAKAQQQSKYTQQDVRQLQKSTDGTIGGASSAGLQFPRTVHSGAHSSMGMHGRQESSESLMVIKEKIGAALLLDGTRYGKTESVISDRERGHQQQRNHHHHLGHLQSIEGNQLARDDNDSLTVIENEVDQERVQSRTLKHTKQLVRPLEIKTLAKPSPSSNRFHHSTKFGKILDQTSLTITKEQFKAASHTPVLKNQAANQIECTPPDNKSDALKLADLEGVKQPAETSMDHTHDFNDSGSANSFTPLPSIQNDYALEIKSFNNGQVKKPYSQQLSTNQFKRQFDLIMDNQLLLWNNNNHSNYPNTPFDLEINIGKSIGDRRKESNQECGGMNQQQEAGGVASTTVTKALKPHQKMQLLFKIVREAKDLSKLQDAKDIFDFIQYEIGTAAQFNRSLPKREEASNAAAADNNQPKYNNLAAQPNSKLADTQLPKPAQQAQKKPKIVSHQKGNDNITFLQQEVSHLRCQLDLMSKQLVAVPGRAIHAQNPYQLGDGQSSRAIQSHTLQAGYFLAAGGADVIEPTIDSSLMESISQPNQYATFSIRNPSIAATTEINTATELIDVAHLTEADEDTSQDFDENVNTMQQTKRKKPTVILVKPSEMLSTRSAKVATESVGRVRGSNTGNGSNLKQTTKLASLLSGRRDHPQKLLLSKKRKSLQQLDQSNSMLSRSRENLETDEGHTMVNQPLVSADVQSFSDRLSHHRDSSTMNKTGKLMSSQRFKQKSLLEMANRNVRMLPRSTGSIQNTTEESGGGTEQSFTATQPKLKYAAFAQIDLSNFDFQRRNDSIQTSQPVLFHEKSQSAIGIKNEPQLTTARALERPHTGIGSDGTNSSLHKIKVEQSHSFLDVAHGSFHQILSTEEKKTRSKFMSIKEEDGGDNMGFGAEVVGQSTYSHKKSFLKRSDSLKCMSISRSSTKAKVLGSAKKKPVGVRRQQTGNNNNFGALTSQKIGLKVLQDYQQSKSRVSMTQLKSAETAAAASSSGVGLKMQFQNSLTLKPPSKLDHLTSAAISLPQTTKNHPVHQKQLKMSAIGTKASYIQPKNSRHESNLNGSNHSKVTVNTLPRQIKMKPTMSRNVTTTQMTQQTGTAPTRTIDGAPGIMKIKTHHRLLKDLIETNSAAANSNRSRAAGHPHK